MIAAELFDQPAWSVTSRPESDALTEDWALDEAALVDIRVDLASTTVGLLFDLRGALQIRDSLVAVLISRGLDRLSWIEKHGRRGRIWYAMTGANLFPERGRFSIQMGFAPDAELIVEADSAEFYVGDMPGVDGAPPDFVDDDETTIRTRMPSWDKPFIVKHATFLDPSSTSWS